MAAIAPDTAVDSESYRVQIGQAMKEYTFQSHQKYRNSLSPLASQSPLAIQQYLEVLTKQGNETRQQPLQTGAGHSST